MTLPRTIHRRNARKRAKARPMPHGHRFYASDWLVKDRLRDINDILATVRLINRSYPR